MKCSVIHCHNECSYGDKLFCTIHRRTWRSYCAERGYNTPLGDDAGVALIHQFHRWMQNESV